MFERQTPGKAVGFWLLAGLVTVVATAADPPPPGKDDWKYDVVYLKSGKSFSGLLVEEKQAHIKLLSITRTAGKPTIVWEEFIKRNEIDRVERLNDDDRAELEQRVKALRLDRELLAAQLKLLDPAAQAKKPVDMVSLQPADWPADPKIKALQYQSTHFNLLSTAKEEVVQLAAIQLEQVYAAYTRALPPRVSRIEPTTILLTGTLDEYKALARVQGSNLVNPAFYDDAKNQIVCGSDLQRLGAELRRLRERHAGLAKELSDREQELKQVYKGAIPNEILQQLIDARNMIRDTEAKNAKAFRDAQERLFRCLYHEAFHAYLATAVYPPADGELPRWLNEGLAQIFETAIVEVGELRVGHADDVRLRAVREALQKKDLLPLTDLLASGPKQFRVAHASDKQVSDKHYLAAWALAFYLTFDRRLLGTKALDEYVQALQRGAEPLDAFQTLVGTPLPQLEKEFREYLRRLKPDGTLNAK